MIYIPVRVAAGTSIDIAAEQAVGFQYMLNRNRVRATIELVFPAKSFGLAEEIRVMVEPEAREDWVIADYSAALARQSVKAETEEQEVKVTGLQRMMRFLLG